MNSDISFDNAQLSDLPFIVDVYNQTIASRMVTADLQTITADSRINWLNAHNQTTRPLWIIKYQGQNCGWISLSTFYGRAAYDKTVEISVYIAKDFRAKKIGGYSIEKIQQHAREYGIETVLSYIFGHNIPSINLFKKLGYQQWGMLPEVAELDGIKRDLVILGRKLF